MVHWRRGQAAAGDRRRRRKTDRRRRRRVVVVVFDVARVVDVVEQGQVFGGGAGGPDAQRGQEVDPVFSAVCFIT